MAKRMRPVLEALERRALLSTVFVNGDDNDIVRDASGNQYLAFHDNTTERLMYAYRPVNGAWTAAVTVDDGGASTHYHVGEYASINLDSSNQPGISYYDSSNGALKYAKFNGTSWSASTVDGAGPGTDGLYTSLVYNATDHPHIAYYRKDSGELKLAVLDGSWVVTPIESTDDTGRYPSLAMQANGRWGIAYEQTSAHKFAYAHQTTGGFAIEPVATTLNAGGFTSLAFDPDDNIPTFTYYEAYNANLVFARAPATDGTGTWSNTIIAGGSNAQGKYSNLWYNTVGGTHRARVVYDNEAAHGLYMVEENSSTPGVFGGIQLVYSGGEFEAEAVRVTDSDFTYTWVTYDLSANPTLHVNDTLTGKTWNPANASTLTSRRRHAAAVFTDPADGIAKMWVLGGARVNHSNGVTTYLQDVYKSGNGTAWTSASGAAFSQRENGEALVFTDPSDGVSKLWMIGGAGPNAVSDTVYKSANGTTWTQVPAAPENLPPVYGHAAAVFPDPANSNKPTMWVFGGRNIAGTFTNDIYNSTDGTHWTHLMTSPSTIFGARTNAVVEVYQGALYLMGGLNSSSVGTADVWKSTNGVAWTRVAGSGGSPSLPDAQFGPLSEASGMVYDSKMWIVNYNSVWYSVDGANWTESIHQAAFSTRDGQASLTFNPGGGDRIWVIAGHQYSPVNQENSDVWYAT